MPLQSAFFQYLHRFYATSGESECCWFDFILFLVTAIDHCYQFGDKDVVDGLAGPVAHRVYSPLYVGDVAVDLSVSPTKGGVKLVLDGILVLAWEASGDGCPLAACMRSGVPMDAWEMKRICYSYGDHTFFLLAMIIL
jgi:hypothetical protein